MILCPSSSSSSTDGAAAVADIYCCFSDGIGVRCACVVCVCVEDANLSRVYNDDYNEAFSGKVLATNIVYNIVGWEMTLKDTLYGWERWQFIRPIEFFIASYTNMYIQRTETMAKYTPNKYVFNAQHPYARAHTQIFTTSESTVIKLNLNYHSAIWY